MADKPRVRRRRPPEPLEPAVVVELYAHLIENTETFGDMARDLAYLWPEMLRGGQIDLKRGGPLALLLEGCVPKDHPVWRNISWLSD